MIIYPFPFWYAMVIYRHTSSAFFLAAAPAASSSAIFLAAAPAASSSAFILAAIQRPLPRPSSCSETTKQKQNES